MEEKLSQCERELGVLRSRCSELEGTMAEVERVKAAVVEENHQLNQEKLQLATSIDQSVWRACMLCCVCCLQRSILALGLCCLGR